MYLMRRRNATTEFLKECMADALLRLLKEKKLDEITVSEITDLADVGRVTFYRNFTRKEDLITFKLSLLSRQYFQKLAQEQLKDMHCIIVEVFKFIYEIQDLLTVLYQAGLIEIAFLPLYEAIRPQSCADRAENYKSSFLSFGLMGIILEWIQSKFKETPEELAWMLEELPGV